MFSTANLRVCKILAMDTRAPLLAMLDDFDDGEIIAAEACLSAVVHRRHQPKVTKPELARLNERRAEFKKIAENHWCHMVVFNQHARATYDNLVEAVPYQDLAEAYITQLGTRYKHYLQRHNEFQRFIDEDAAGRR